MKPSPDWGDEAIEAGGGPEDVATLCRLRPRYIAPRAEMRDLTHMKEIEVGVLHGQRFARAAAPSYPGHARSRGRACSPVLVGPLASVSRLPNAVR
jgi:hypothetical protein